MPTIARIIGGAGTGKTTRLLQIMERTLEAGVRDPMQLGFVSFTRVARREASTRAADKFGLRADELERDGWFRTLHSVCHKTLGIGKELIGGTADDRRWIADALGCEIETAGDTEADFTEQVFHGSSEADIALGLWDAARNRLLPLKQVWQAAASVDDRVPPLEDVEAYVERYEQAKRLDGRCDFCDILLRFAGIRMWTEGPENSEPEGDVPGVPVWFFDEAQDSSALLHAVETRLMAHAKWVYICGDPMQSIFSFAGSSSKHFMGLDVAKQDVLPKTYRCPAPIHNLGEEILRQCSDYWDRGIKAADHPGTVEHRLYRDGVADEIDPRGEWLILTRSNYHARRVAATLDSRNIPWTPTRGRGGWNAPVRNAGLVALLNLQRGEPIDGGQWGQAIKLLPSRHEGQTLLVSGTKKKYAGSPETLTEWHPWLMRGDLADVGATPELIRMIQTGAWRQFASQADSFVAAIDRWGEELVAQPIVSDGPPEQRRGVRVGTVHSIKGGEANNVVYLTSTSEQVAAGQQSQSGFDEERRVEYVAVTRARQRLIVASERTRNRAEVPEL